MMNRDGKKEQRTKIDKQRIDGEKYALIGDEEQTGKKMCS